MDEKQLRKLIGVLGQLGSRFKAKKHGNGAESEQASSSLYRFGQLPQNRIDEIIKSVMPDWTPPGTESESERPANSLKSILTGAFERQYQVHSGQAPPIQQPTVPGVAPKQTNGESKTKQPSRVSNLMDTFQLALDAIGVVDPTPIADGANAAISLGRAFITDPERRKEHLQNAAISAVSMIPYVGDTAKIAKLPRAAKTVQRTAQTIRGVDRATDGVKVMTAAEKRATRSSYRDAVEQATKSTETQQSTQSAVPPTAIGSPDLDGGRNTGTNAAREEAKGVEEYDTWSQKFKNAGNKVADFAGILGKGATKAAAFVGSLNLMNTGVLTLNRDLSAYNGKLATSYAKADAADIQRDIRKAGQLSGSLSKLNREQSELKDKLSDAMMPLQNVAINLLAEVTRITNDAIDFFAMVIELVPGAKAALEAAKKAGKPDYDATTAINSFLQDVSDGKFDGKRPSFIDPKTHILDPNDHTKVFGP